MSARNATARHAASWYGRRVATRRERAVDPADRALVVTEWKVRGGFALALACLSAVGAASFLGAVRFDSATAWVGRTQDVISSSKTLLAEVTDAETEERGYIITGDDAYLALFRAAVSGTDAALRKLRSLMTNDPGGTAHLDAVGPLIAVRLKNLEGMVDLRRERGFDATRSAIATGPNRALHEAIQREVDALTDAEASLLARRQEIAKRSAVVIGVIIIGGGALAAAVVALVLFGLRRDFAMRMRAEVALRATKREAQDRLVSQLQRLNLLQHITRAVGERQNLPSIYAVVVETLETHLPAQLCCICSLDARTGDLGVIAASTHSAALALDGFVSVERNGLVRCVDGDLVYAPDLAKDPPGMASPLTACGLRSLVAAPLLDERKVFAVLVCARERAESFSGEECEFLRQLSDHVALAAHQTQLHDALRGAYDELRHSQREALQLERLRVLGQLASGIAHDINNTISPVALYVESLLESEPALSAGGRRQVEVIQRGIEDVAQTVSRMRDFSRQREPQTTLDSVNINDIIGHVVDLTRARWSDLPQQRGVVIDLRTDLAASVPTIRGIEGELRDALVNLVFNAVDAMPVGGTLFLRTQLVDSGSGGHDKLVRLEVADSGVGMNEDTRRRCMEPFFTTKGERGSGLGLAMVYGTMQRHGAEIRIDSVLGRGTTFRFDFPVRLARRVEVAAPPSGDMPPLDILVIDDDVLVAGAVRDTLERDGHRITTADGGQAGIDLFLAASARGAPFDAVLTDMGMPHVDGSHVAAAVRSAEPTTLVILLTGWGQRLQIDGESPTHVDCVLSKPPTRAALRSALARAAAHAHA